MRYILSILLALLVVIGGAAVVVFGDTDDSSLAAGEAIDDASVDSSAASSSEDDVLLQPDLSGDEDIVLLDPAEDPQDPVLDPDDPAAVSAETISITTEAVYMAVPEDNVYPPSAPLMGGVYLDVDTQQLGELLIYIPTAYQYRSFTKTTAGAPVNITVSTISGYTYDGNDYNIRWSSFGRAQYRPVSGSYSYQDLDITEITNTNVVFVESIEDLPPVPDADMLSLISIFLLGVIVLCLFMRRF